MQQSHQSIQRSDSGRLGRVLNPQSIAVVGASEDLAKVGGRVIHLLQRSKYRGKVYPVNPKRASVQGLRCYASAAAVGEPIDLAVIALPAADVETQLCRCLDAGIGGLMVLSAGFAELDAVGAERQARLAALAARYRVPMIGPNCLGIINGNSGLFASSTFAVADRELVGGQLSFVTQSGAIGTYWLDMALAAGFGVSSWVSTGNEADVDLSEVLEYLVDDEQTRVIGLYIEGLRNGPLFRQAAVRALERRKPLLVLKSGRSNIGALAAASHTGALAGEDALYQAFFEQFGACRVDSLSEMFAVSRVLLTQPVRPGRRICVMSVSGGAGVMVTDALISNHMQVPDFSPATKARLRSILPEFAHPANPLDLTAELQSNTDMLGRALAIVVDSGEYDGLIFFSGALGHVQEQLASNVIRATQSWNCPRVVIWQAQRPLAVKLLTAAGIPVFEEIPTAVDALAKALWLADRWQPPLPSARCAPSPDAAASVARCLTENAGKAYLREQAGLQTPPGVMLHTLQRVEEQVRSLLPPYAVKLQSPQLLHKSGSGGVVLNVKDAIGVEQAASAMFALAAQRDMRCEGILVEQMVPVEFEFLVGFRRDPTLGPLLIIGRGGLDVEVDPDVARAFLPVTEADILALFKRLRSRLLLGGFRGRQAAPLAAVARVVCRLASAFEDNQGIREIEINPLATDSNGAVIALDAAVWLEGHEAERSS